MMCNEQELPWSDNALITKSRNMLLLFVRLWTLSALSVLLLCVLASTASSVAFVTGGPIAHVVQQGPIHTCVYRSLGTGIAIQAYRRAISEKTAIPYTCVRCATPEEPSTILYGADSISESTTILYDEPPVLELSVRDEDPFEVNTVYDHPPVLEVSRPSPFDEDETIVAQERTMMEVEEYETNEEYTDDGGFATCVFATPTCSHLPHVDTWRFRDPRVNWPDNLVNTDVLGDEEKKNDVIVCGSVLKAKQHVIFFGGDVQNYPEEMKKNNPEHFRWNLINTAQMLHTSFRDSVVFVVKPAAMLHNTLSLYQNFLNFTSEGRPLFSDNFGALSHVVKLYKHISSKVSAMEGHSYQDVSTSDVADCQYQAPVKLIGFSKGCVVLNQFVFELQEFKDNKEIKQFLEKVSDIYWLDSGHTGRQNAWITDDDKLKNLKDLNMQIHVHVTPYQIRDPNRQWIGREEAVFLEKLRKLRAHVIESPHFMDKAPSIDNHFKVLQKI